MKEKELIAYTVKNYIGKCPTSVGVLPGRVRDYKINFNNFTTKIDKLLDSDCIHLLLCGMEFKILL